jgi:hypothetical protein
MNSKIMRLFVAAITVFLTVQAAAQQSARCYLFPLGGPLDIPSIADRTPSLPAHYFRAGYYLASPRDRTQYTADMVVWRTLCSEYGDKPVVALRLNQFNQDKPWQPQYLPVITVAQGGVRLGSFGARDSGVIVRGFESGFRWGGYTFPDLFGSLYSVPANVGLSAPLIPAAGVNFDPGQAFDLILGENPDAPDYIAHVPAATAPGNVSFLSDDIVGLWWNPDESGWGLGVDRNEAGIVFAVWNIYDEQGKPVSLVMPAGTGIAANKVSGAVYRPHGPYFADTFDASRVQVGDPVGSFTIEFNDNTTGTLSYSIGAYSGNKSIRRFIDGPKTRIFDRRGTWWDNREPGWGMTIDQQDRNTGGLGSMFVVWYTYDASGNLTWFVVPDARAILSHDTLPRYEGAAYSPRGSFFGAVYDATQFSLGDPVGKLSFPDVVVTYPGIDGSPGWSQPAYFDYEMNDGSRGRKSYKPFKY